MKQSGDELIVKRWSEMSRDDVFEMVLLRTQVFFVEQQIDEQDFDDADRDERTIHMWIEDQRGTAAYLRVRKLDEADEGAHRTFGRVAVRQDRRHQGLARKLVRDVVSRFGNESLTIHSQEYVVRLYEEFGFAVVGEKFVEAGLPHRTMTRAAS